MQIAPLEIGPVDVGDLQLAARRGPHACRDVDHVVFVEVEPRDRIVRGRFRRLFYDVGGPAGLVEAYHPVASRLPDVLAEDSGAPLPLGGRTPEPRTPGPQRNFVPP